MFIDYRCVYQCVHGLDIILLKIMRVKENSVLFLVIALSVSPILAKTENRVDRQSRWDDTSFFGGKWNLLRSRRCNSFFI